MLLQLLCTDGRALPHGLMRCKCDVEQFPCSCIGVSHAKLCGGSLGSVYLIKTWSPLNILITHVSCQSAHVAQCAELNAQRLRT